MKRGPTKATMERLLAEKRTYPPGPNVGSLLDKPTTPELVTDWIPCTTPPVRDGVYEVEMVKYNGPPLPPLRDEFKDGKWVVSEGLNRYPHVWKWRGVRRWVLQGPDDNLMSLIAREPVTIYLIAARPRSTKWGGLVKARPFRTEKAAQRFADSRPRLGLTAVLP